MAAAVPSEPAHQSAPGRPSAATWFAREVEAKLWVRQRRAGAGKGRHPGAPGRPNAASAASRSASYWGLTPFGPRPWAVAPIPSVGCRETVPRSQRSHQALP
eukprot:scaffold72612_cov32-Tisochrysis_lutea.AAC.3